MIVFGTAGSNLRSGFCPSSRRSPQSLRDLRGLRGCQWFAFYPLCREFPAHSTDPHSV